MAIRWVANQIPPDEMDIFVFVSAMKQIFMSDIVLICYAAAVSARADSKIIFVCVCICYEMCDQFENIFLCL